MNEDSQLVVGCSIGIFGLIGMGVTIYVLVMWLIKVFGG